MVSVVNGTAPYTYTWSGTTATGNNISNLSAGSYYVTVSDAIACTETASFTISQPLEMQLTLSETDVTYPSGTNGGVTLSLSGGVPAYSFNWSNGSTSQNISGVSAGQYSVTVTDNQQCTATSSAQVIENYQPIGISISHNNVSCFGGANGSASAMVTGGNPPYSYEWSNGETTSNISN